MSSEISLDRLVEFQSRSYSLFTKINYLYFDQIKQFGFNKFWRLCISNDNKFSMISDASVEEYRQYLKHNLLDISEIIRSPDTVNSGIYLDTSVYAGKMDVLRVMYEVLDVQSLVYCVCKICKSHYSVYVYNSPDRIVFTPGFTDKILRLSNHIERETFIKMPLESKPWTYLSEISRKDFSSSVSSGNLLCSLSIDRISFFLQKIGLIEKDLDSLNDNELQSLYMLGKGFSYEEIAIELNTTKRNLYYYISSIREKLGLHLTTDFNEVSSLVSNSINSSLSYAC